MALADACFRREATRTEAGELALWKRVTMSLVLCWMAYQLATGQDNKSNEWSAGALLTYKAKHGGGLAVVGGRW